MKNMMIGVSLMILLTGQCIARIDSTFKLSDYKLPNLKRRALDINFDMDGSNKFTKTTSDSDDPLKGNESHFYNSVRVVLTSYLNSVKKQQETYANFNSYTALDGQKQDLESKRKYYRFLPSLEYNSINRYYYCSNKFYEIDYRFSYGFQSYGNKRWEQEILQEDRKSKNNSLRISLPLKIGKGRIEDVHDAGHAIYLLDELAKENKTSRDITNEDILKFAAFISELKNERFFDSRLKRIAELEALDLFLQSNSYTMDIDSRYFTTLLDFWGYGGSYSRTSGKRISFAVTPEYSNLNSNITSITGPNIDSKSNNFSLSGGLEFLREKPVNLYWQNDIRIYAFANINKNKLGENLFVFKERANDLQIGYMQSFAYYPNTRTRAKFAYSALYYKNLKKGVTRMTETDYSNLSAYTYFSMDYYISPQFRFNFYTRIYYNGDASTYRYSTNADDQMTPDVYDFSSSSKSRKIELDFSIGLLYSIF